MTVLATATSLLAAVVDALTDPPARQVLTVGTPTDPLQGEQVAVGWIRNFSGVPGQERPGPDSSCWSPLVAEFQIRVGRCVVTSTTAEDTAVAVLAAGLEQIAADGEAVRVALRSWLPDRPEPQEATKEDVWVGPVLAYRPQGLAAGFVIAVQAAL